jgi:hypothetical protein
MEISRKEIVDVAADVVVQSDRKSVCPCFGGVGEECTSTFAIVL